MYAFADYRCSTEFAKQQVDVFIYRFTSSDGGDLSGYNSSAGDYPVVAAYGEQEYWDARYTEETKAGLSSKHYDWYFGARSPPWVTRWRRLHARCRICRDQTVHFKRPPHMLAHQITSVEVMSVSGGARDTP